MLFSKSQLQQKFIYFSTIYFDMRKHMFKKHMISSLLLWSTMHFSINSENWHSVFAVNSVAGTISRRAFRADPRQISHGKRFWKEGGACSLSSSRDAITWRKSTPMTLQLAPSRHGRWLHLCSGFLLHHHRFQDDSITSRNKGASEKMIGWSQMYSDLDRSGQPKSCHRYLVDTDWHCINLININMHRLICAWWGGRL